MSDIAHQQSACFKYSSYQRECRGPEKSREKQPDSKGLKIIELITPDTSGWMLNLCKCHSIKHNGVGKVELRRWKNMIQWSSWLVLTNSLFFFLEEHVMLWGENYSYTLKKAISTNQYVFTVISAPYTVHHQHKGSHINHPFRLQCKYLKWHLTYLVYRKHIIGLYDMRLAVWFESSVLYQEHT